MRLGTVRVSSIVMELSCTGIGVGRDLNKSETASDRFHSASQSVWAVVNALL